MRKIIGPDISLFQDDPQTPQGVNFTRMNQVSDFVIVRAGQNLWPDSDFPDHWRRARASGLPRGSYWLYDSRANPKQQADLWFEQLGDDQGELPLFADFEEAYGGPFTGWMYWEVFLDRIKTLAGIREVGIYTAYFYWKNNAPNPATQPIDLEYFHRYPLWIANYDVSQPFVPKPWSADEWLFWQFTSKGDGPSYGAESPNIDLNYFNGDAEQFADRFGVPVPQDPVPPEDPTGKRYRVTTGTLYVRQGPGTNYESIGYLQKDDIVEALGSNPTGSWYRIRRLTDNLTGWSSSDYLERVTTTVPPVEGGRYRVNTRSLYVREGPGTNYRSVGSLVSNDIVELLQTSTDRSWMRVRRLSDGLTGWASSTYLVKVTTAPPPPPADGQKYRVRSTSRIHVREGPGTQYRSLGYLQPNEIVTAISVNPEQTWRQIRRNDGLTGWSSARYLALLVTV